MKDPVAVPIIPCYSKFGCFCAAWFWPVWVLQIETAHLYLWLHFERDTELLQREAKSAGEALQAAVEAKVRQAWRRAERC